MFNTSAVGFGHAERSPFTITSRTPRTVKDRAYAELSANVGQTSCKIAIHLLDMQVDSQARAFEKEGGFSERLYKVRSEIREANRD